ncbi:hypothetical protein H6F67_00730 [Microcoleus sp. FACHB-1515]|uniref:hypothetical protein n=1 Tax=Cyanophyceae TaxID=3028117 RepID=UPI001687A830|nr:hypothetical protein [Microcoleus sp. FACHB-1515]MBD2088397.1 hypothetical protein [Microcoleus sp. FACHB-1515]
MTDSNSGESKPKKRKAEMVRIVIYGTQDGTEQIIREFYLCRFSAPSEWGPIVPVSGSKTDEVSRTYTRRLR